MYSTNNSFNVLRKTDSNIIVFIAVLATICAVFCGVNLFVGDTKLPKGLRGTTNYFIIGALVFTAITFVYYYVKRFKINVIGGNNLLTVEILDKELAEPLIIRSSFKLHRQWTHQLAGKGPKMKLIYVTILNERDEAIVTFEGALGAAYSAPVKFEYVDVLNGGRIITAEKVYSTGKAIDISDEINIYLNYINKKKA